MAPPRLSFERFTCPTVQLRHEMPDGSAHVDWMIAREPEARSGLLSFRVGRRVDELKAGESIEAVRISDHRPAYLEYEGAVSDGRGQVRRLCGGRLRAAESNESGDVCELRIEWRTGGRSEVTQRLTLAHHGGDRWRITCESGSARPPAAVAAIREDS